MINLSKQDFSSAGVLVAGDVMLDCYWQGDTNRISPEAPIPIVHVQEKIQKPGGAGNVAINIQSLGTQCCLMGLIGQDRDGELLESILKQAEIRTHLLSQPNLDTIVKLRVLSRHQQLLRMDFEKKFDLDNKSDFLNLFKQNLSNTNTVILSDYAKGTLANPQDFILLAKEKNIPVLIDPKGNSFEPYNNATLLTPNLKEFELVVGECYSNQELIDKAYTVIDRHHLSALLITQGEKGMTLIQPNQPPFHVASQACDVFDVTGAGDTVIAVLASVLAAGADLITATQLANKAAGTVVSKLGAATVTLEELLK